MLLLDGGAGCTRHMTGGTGELADHAVIDFEGARRGDAIDFGLGDAEEVGDGGVVATPEGSPGTVQAQLQAGSTGFGQMGRGSDHPMSLACRAAWMQTGPKGGARSMIGTMKDKTVMKGQVDVYVPAAGAMGIKPGSGIVGQPIQDGKVEIYYEGNLMGASNLQNYAERCYCAAGRMKARYPTVAHMVVDTGAVVRIGSLDLRTGAVNLEVDLQVMATWVDLNDPAETQAPSVSHHLEHKLGLDMMRHPSRHQRLLATLPQLEGKAREAAIRQAALGLADD